MKNPFASNVSQNSDLGTDTGLAMIETPFESIGTWYNYNLIFIISIKYKILYLKYLLIQNFLIIQLVVYHHPNLQNHCFHFQSNFKQYFYFETLFNFLNYWFSY